MESNEKREKEREENWSRERKKKWRGNRAEDISNQSLTTDANVNGAPSNRISFLVIKKRKTFMIKFMQKRPLGKYMCLCIQQLYNTHKI